MDDINYFPEISEEEYPSFVALPVTSISPTYMEWITQQQQANLDRARGDQRPVAVKVRLGDFKAFCDRRGHGYLRQWLHHYALEYGPRR
jgi:hypothetical protein